MNEEPPIPQERRMFGGWVILIVLLGLMLTEALYGSLVVRGERKDYAQEQLTLGQALRVDKIKGLGSFAQLESQTSDTLSAAIRKVRPDLGSQEMAPRFLAVAEYEQRKKVDADVLQRLSDSKSPIDAALAHLYGSPKIQSGQAKSIQAALPSDEKIYQLAKVHANERAGIAPSGRADLVPIWKLFGTAVMVLLLAVVILGCPVAWILFFSGRVSGTLKPLGLPFPPRNATDSDRFAWKGAILLTSFLLLSLVGEGLSLKIGVAGQMIGPIGILLVLVAIDGWNFGGKTLRLRDMGFGIPQWRHVGWAIGGLCAELPVSMGLAVLAESLLKKLPVPEHPAITEIQNSSNVFLILSITFLATITAPIWEEIMFRGCLFPAFSKWMNLAGAAVLSSLIFAAIHPQGIALWLSLGTVACASCTLAYHTKSLMPSILLHAMHNTLLVLLSIMMS